MSSGARPTSGTRSGSSDPSSRPRTSEGAWDTKARDPYAQFFMQRAASGETSAAAAYYTSKQVCVCVFCPCLCVCVYAFVSERVCLCKYAFVSEPVVCITDAVPSLPYPHGSHCTHRLSLLAAASTSSDVLRCNCNGHASFHQWRYVSVVSVK